MTFDPSQYGATPVTGGDSSPFDPSKYGATPVEPSLQTRTPEQASQALGGSTNLLLNMMAGLGNTYGNTAQGVALGAMKTISTAGAQNAGPVGKAMMANAPGYSQEVQALQNTQPQGAAQQTGFTGERIGEFFAPEAGEARGVEMGSTLLNKASEYVSKLPEAIGATGKLATTLAGTLKTALSSAFSAGEMGTIAKGQGGDVQSSATLGAFGGATSEAAATFGPELSNALVRADFRLSPSQEAKTQKIANKAANFIVKNNILGSDSTKFAKLSTLNSKLENVLQSSLPDNVSVPKNEIIGHLNSWVEGLRDTDPAVYPQARTQADQAISLLQEQTSSDPFTKGGAISVKNALSGKRSWASMAFKTSQKAKQDPTVSKEGAYAAEQAYQLALSNTLDRTNTAIKIPNSMQTMFGGQSEVSLEDFNKVYSDAINAKNLTGIAQYKNDAGLFGRLFGLWVGKTVGQAIIPGLGGELVGAGIGEAASSHLPGIARNVMERGLAHPNFPTNTAKIIQGTEDSFTPSNPDQQSQ